MDEEAWSHYTYTQARVRLELDYEHWDDVLKWAKVARKAQAEMAAEELEDCGDKTIGE